MTALLYFPISNLTKHGCIPKRSRSSGRAPPRYDMWKTLDILSKTLWPEQSVKWPDNFSDQDKQGVMLILKECVQSLLPKWVDFNETANSDWEWATLLAVFIHISRFIKNFDFYVRHATRPSCELRADGGLLKIKIRLNPKTLQYSKRHLAASFPSFKKKPRICLKAQRYL